MGMGNKIDPNIIPEHIDTNGDLIGRKVASYELAENHSVIDRLLEWKKELRELLNGIEKK